MEGVEFDLVQTERRHLRMHIIVQNVSMLRMHIIVQNVSMFYGDSNS